MQFQQLQQQIEKVNEHVQHLNSQLSEIDNSTAILKSLEETKTQSEILAPIANGIFIKAKLEDNQNLLVNVGADTVVQKSTTQVITLLDEQKDNIAEKMAHYEAMLQDLHLKAMNLFQEE